MKRQDLLSHAALQKLAIALLLALCFPVAARATDVEVDCNIAGHTVQAVIDSLAGTPGPHKITATGNCAADPNGVYVYFSGLTIIGADGQTTTMGYTYVENSQQVVLRKLTFDNSGLQATGSQITILGCTFQNYPDAAIYADNDSKIAVGNKNVGNEVRIANNLVGIWTVNSTLTVAYTTVENQTEDAVYVQGGSGSIGNSTIRSNGYGVGVGNGARFTLNGLNLIANNGPYGVLVFRGADLGIGGGIRADGSYNYTTIEGHTQFGMWIADSTVVFNGTTGVLHQVRNNGVGGGGINSGIVIARPSTLLLRYIAVTGNGGAGVDLRAGGYVQVWNASVTGNQGDGIRLSHNSVAEFGLLDSFTGTQFAANSTVSANSGEQIACDETSSVLGDLIGLPKIKCGTK